MELTDAHKKKLDILSTFGVEWWSVQERTSSGILIYYTWHVRYNGLETSRHGIGLGDAAYPPVDWIYAQGMEAVRVSNTMASQEFEPTQFDTQVQVKTKGVFCNRSCYMRGYNGDEVFCHLFQTYLCFEDGNGNDYRCSECLKAEIEANGAIAK